MQLDEIAQLKVRSNEVNLLLKFISTLYSFRVRFYVSIYYFRPNSSVANYAFSGVTIASSPFPPLKNGQSVVGCAQ
jgi:hypothetical protein